MFETEFYALLASDGPLQALLGNSLSPEAERADKTSGIFPALWPEAATLPGVEWHVVSDRSIDSMEGVNRTGHKRIQLNAYAENYLACKRVAKAVVDLLGGYQGKLSEGGYLSSVIRNNVGDVFEEKPWLFRAILDFSLMYTDAGN